MINKQSSKSLALTQARQNAWFKALNRAGFFPSQFKHARVCDLHFISGKSAVYSDVTNPDWVPTLHLGYERVESNEIVDEVLDETSNGWSYEESIVIDPINNEFADVDVTMEGEAGASKGRQTCIAASSSGMSINLLKENTNDMATIEKITPAPSISSSKAAEIYRENSGRFVYVCFHCGSNFDNITDTLAHIDIHFTAQINIKTDDEPLELLDIKCELLDDTSQEVVDPTQLEHIFIDCSNKMNLMNEEECPRMETADILGDQQTLSVRSENLSDMEGLFEWKCLYCGTLFKKFVKLKLHLIKHINHPLPSRPVRMTDSEINSIKAEYAFKCTLCSLEFFDSSSSEEHLKDFHDARPSIKCFTCSKTFVSPELLKEHMSTAHTRKDDVTIVTPAKINRPKIVHVEGIDNPSLCILCDKTFNGRTLDLLQHTFGHFGLQIFNCSECPSKFQNFTSITDHKKRQHSLTHEHNYDCRFCDNSFTNLLDFVVHAFTHHLDEGDQNNSDLDENFNYNCRLCFMNFTKWLEASAHRKIHTEDQLPEGVLPTLPMTNTRCLTERAKSCIHRTEFLYNCLACTSTLSGSFEARKHWITEHKPPTENGIDDPLQHRIISSTEKESFRCYECDATCESQYYLKKHILMHFNVQPYTCTVCKKGFSFSSNAIRHMAKTHLIKSSDNSFLLNCRYCNAEFAKDSTFISHMFNDHLYMNFNINENLDGQCEYQCVYCKETFMQRNSMSKHLRIHKNEKIPKQQTHTTSVESSINALRHVVKFMYCCLHCPRKFRLPYAVSEHVKNKHRIENTNGPKECEEPITDTELDEQLEERAKQHSETICVIKDKPKEYEQPTYCTVCNAAFPTWRSMVNHRARQHPETNITNKDKPKEYEQPIYCTVCTTPFPTWRSMINHRTKQHPETICVIKNKPKEDEKPTYCTVCNTPFPTWRSMVNHRARQHPETHITSKDKPKEYEQPIYCTVCKAAFPTWRSMVNHRTKLHPDTSNRNKGKPKEEDELPTTDTNYDTQLECIKEEQIIENEDKPTVDEQPKLRDTMCNLCDRVFPTWRSMVNHRAKEHPETINKNAKYKSKNNGQKKKKKSTTDTHCSHCNITFLSNRSMVNHRSQRHPELLSPDRFKNRPSYVCGICGKVCRERSNFNHHMETHERTHWYSCDICKKSYRLKNSLQTHMLSHTNEKNFVCEQCGKSFYTVSKLNLHNQVHENLTFQCDKCQKVFYTRNNFSKHKKTHLDNVRKKCEMCDNTFKSTVSLRVHMLLHSDKKKFSCRFCNLTFAQSSGRRGHERLRHGY